MKHWVLLEVLELLNKDGYPIEYLDSHAGGGSYPLDQEGKTRAVSKVLASDLAGLDRLRNIIQPELNKGLYPGSPMLVSRTVPAGSRMRLFELLPEVKGMLESAMAGIPACEVIQGDGFPGVGEHCFKKSHQGLILMDPPYEVQNDYSEALACIQNLRRNNPKTTVMLWCPVFDRSQLNEFADSIGLAGIANVLYLEMLVKAEGAEGMRGSGMFVINPPSGLEEQFLKAMPAVSAFLAEDNKERVQTHWLAKR